MKSKKQLSVLLICSMMLSVFAGNVFADETYESNPDEGTVIEETEATEVIETSEEPEVTETEVTESEVFEESRISEETFLSEETCLGEETCLSEESLLSEETLFSEELPEEAEVTDDVEEIEDVDVEAGSVKIDENNFPCIYIRRVAYNADSDGNGYLSQTEMDAVTKIEVPDDYVTDLKGIEYFQNVSMIWFFHLDMESVDFSNMKNLRSASITVVSDTATISFSGCSEMRSIFINGAGLKNLNVTGCSELTSLHLNYCTDLKSLDLRACNKLEQLECTNSGLSTLKITGCPLKYLDCSNTALTSLDLTGMNNLQRLCIDHTSIGEIDVSGAPAIRTIYLNIEPSALGNGVMEITDDSEEYLFRYSYGLTVKGGFWSPSWISCSDVTSGSATITWAPVSSAEGYQVWRSKNRDSGFVCIYSGSSTSKESTSLSADTEYYYKVRAYRTVGGKKVYSDYCETLSLTTIPAPQITTAVVVTPEKVKLGWTSIRGASGYELVSFDGYEPEAGTQVGYFETSATVNVTLVAGNYAVRAYKIKNGKKIYGTLSNTITLVAPHYPYISSISEVGRNQLTLTWNRQPSGINVEVWRSINRTDGYICLGRYSGNKKVSTNLRPGTTYYYKIRAYKIVNSYKVYTEYCDPIEVTTMQVPKITDIMVLSSTKFMISWTPISGADDYEIRYMDDRWGGERVYLSLVDNVCTATIDLTRANQGNYVVYPFITVNGQRVYGNGSRPVRFVRNSVPSNVNIINIGRDNMTIVWDKETENYGAYTYYEVWRSKSPSSGFVCLGRYSNTMKVSTNLSPNTTYYYKVRAYSFVYDESGTVHRYYTDYSNVVSGTTKK